MNMKDCKEIIQGQMELLFGRLKNDSYLAHICPGKSAESLQEHTAKVVERACWLIGKHGLEKVVDRLIPGIAGKYSENVQEELKRMFMAVFVFHDTGKVNDNFQYSRMLNRLFKHRKTEILVPAYGHSFLSAWLFLAFELDRVWQDPCLTEEEKKEQALLRKQYVADVKKNLAAQLNNIDMVNPDGSVENLGDKYGKKTGLS